MMKVEELEALFEKHGDEEYIKFDRVENKRSPRPDIHAFLLLDELCPATSVDMVCGASHDEIYLDASLENIKDATEAQIVELIRCGVRVDDYNEHLCMFA